MPLWSHTIRLTFRSTACDSQIRRLLQLGERTHWSLLLLILLLYDSSNVLMGSCSWSEGHLPWAMAIASSPITTSYHLRDLLSQTVCSGVLLLHLKANNCWIIVWRLYIRHLSLASIADMLIWLRNDLLSSSVLLFHSLALTIYSVIGIYYLFLELKNFWDIVWLIA